MERNAEFRSRIEAVTVGAFALCLNERELQESHLLPRALYKGARDTSRSNPRFLLHSPALHDRHSLDRRNQLARNPLPAIATADKASNVGVDSWSGA